MAGIIHWELLDGWVPTQSDDVYCQQLRRLAEALRLKRPNA